MFALPLVTCSGLHWSGFGCIRLHCLALLNTGLVFCSVELVVSPHGCVFGVALVELPLVGVCGHTLLGFLFGVLPHQGCLEPWFPFLFGWKKVTF